MVIKKSKTVVAGTVCHLQDEYQIENLRVLFEILLPVLAFILPLISRRFQNSHIFRKGSARLLVGVNDNYPFL